jgi:hypothetical protein
VYLANFTRIRLGQNELIDGEGALLEGFMQYSTCASVGGGHWPQSSNVRSGPIVYVCPASIVHSTCE